MAVTAITPVKLGLSDFALDAVTFEAATAAADGFTVPFGDTDTKVLLLFQNTNASATARTATVKKGNSIQGVSDLTSGDIGAGDIAAVTVESGRFKHVSGAMKGLVHIVPSHAELKMAAVILP